MSDLPDFATYKAAIDAEIARIESDIADREVQIGALGEQNTAARERITNLRGAGEKVAVALDALQGVGPMLDPLPAISEQKRQRPKIKQTLTSVLKEAGPAGMTESDIIALVKSRDQIELNPGSMRSFLYTAQRDGLVHKLEGARWCIIEQPQLAPAEPGAQQPQAA